jgi:hypothetical protein
MNKKLNHICNSIYKDYANDSRMDDAIETLRQFELDAYKAGMTRAADKIQTREDLKQAILTERDNMKELP